MDLDQRRRRAGAFPGAVHDQHRVRSAHHRHGRTTTIYCATGSDEEAASSSAVPAAQEAVDLALRVGCAGDASSDHLVCVGVHELIAPIIVDAGWLLPLTRAADADDCGVCPPFSSVQAAVPTSDKKQASVESKTSFHVAELHDQYLTHFSRFKQKNKLHGYGSAPQ